VFGAKPTKLVNPSDSELFSNFDLPDQLQPKAGEQFSLALVRKNADGTGSIVFGTDNVAAVTSVLALAGMDPQVQARASPHRSSSAHRQATWLAVQWLGPSILATMTMKILNRFCAIGVRRCCMA
jgi:hypothetical protein